jgi:hypothetical protein
VQIYDGLHAHYAFPLDERNYPEKIFFGVERHRAPGRWP